LGSDADYVNLHPANSISLLLPKDYDRSEFRMELTVYSIENGQTLTAPIKAGEVLGEVSVLRDGRNYGTVKLVASSNVDLSRTRYMQSSVSETLHSTRFKTIFWIIVLLLAIYICWVIVYRIKHMKHRLAVRDAEKAKAQAEKLAAAPPEPPIEFFSSAPTRATAEDSVPDPQKVTAFPAAAPKATPVSTPAPAAPAAPAPQSAPPAAAKPAATTTSTPAPQSTPAAAAKPAVPPVQTPRPPLPKNETAGLSDKDLSILQDEAERDYFEEFFRKK